MSNYNPFISAAQTAIQALTTDEAKAFYSVTAQAHTQVTIDAALSVGIALYQIVQDF